MRSKPDLKAGLLFDYVLKELDPTVYNQAIADARAFFEQRTARPSFFIRIRAVGVTVLGLVAAGLAACGSPLSPSELRALAEAEARWAARSFPDYSIEMRQGCFCPPVLTQWARVEVVAGRVDRVVLLATGAEVPAAQRVLFSTVEDVFNHIRTASHDDWLKDVVVAFDPELGFPTYVGFISKPNVADAGSSYSLRNAGPVP